MVGLPPSKVTCASEPVVELGMDLFAHTTRPTPSSLISACSLSLWGFFLAKPDFQKAPNRYSPGSVRNGWEPVPGQICLGTLSQSFGEGKDGCELAAQSHGSQGSTQRAGYEKRRSSSPRL